MPKADPIGAALSAHYEHITGEAVPPEMEAMLARLGEKADGAPSRGEDGAPSGALTNRLSEGSR